MEKKKNYFKQNAKTQTVTIDLNVKPTKEEEKMVDMLLKAGYKLRMKKAADEKAKINNESIMAALKNDKTAIAEYEKIKKEKGFFGARKWYIEKYQQK